MPRSRGPRFPHLLAVEIAGLCAIAIAVAIIDDYQTLAIREAIREDTAQIASNIAPVEPMLPEKGSATFDVTSSRPDNTEITTEITRRPHPMRSARSNQNPGKRKTQRDRMTMI